jgi:hypothetical protein
MTIRGVLGRSILVFLLLWVGPHAGATAALSERAESLRDSWLEILASPASPLHMGGELEIVERSDGSLYVVMPEVVLRDPSWDEEGPDSAMLELGTLTATLHPVAEQRWATVWDIPGEMTLRDGVGSALGVLQIEKRVLSGLWAEDLETFLTADLRLEGLSLTLDADALLAAVGEEAGDGEVTPHGIVAERMLFSLDLAESEPGVVSGPLALSLDGLLLKDAAGEAMAGLGSVRTWPRILRS